MNISIMALGATERESNASPEKKTQSIPNSKPSHAVMRKHRANVPVILFTEFFSCSSLFYIFVLA